MARQRGQAPQRHIKGFRPGKEPPRLRKQAAKQQFGNLSPTQARMVEMFAERDREGARALIRRWLTGLLAGAVVLGVIAAALFTWSMIAGIIVAVIALAVLFLWWRLRKQRADLEAVADTVSGQGTSRRGKHR